MQQSATMRRTSARTAIAIMLAVVGMLALGGAWSSATAAPGDNGANQGGPYDPSGDCEGENQGNSQNCNGQQSGPSDDKNPPGQVGNEHDRGYECDDNKGVGDKGGNPAHTGCTTTTIETNTQGCPAGQVCELGCTSNCGTTTTTVPGEEPPSAEVLGLTEEAPAAPAAPGSPAAAAPATQLAFTGVTADVLGFLGLALVAFGAAFMLIARRNEESLFGTSVRS